MISIFILLALLNLISTNNDFLDISSIKLKILNKKPSGYMCEISFKTMVQEILCNRCSMISKILLRDNEKFVEIESKGEVEIGVKLKNGMIIPFKIICDGSEVIRDKIMVRNVDVQVSTDYFDVSWSKVLNRDIYTVIYNDGIKPIKLFQQIVKSKTRIQLYNLKPKTLYQICISSMTHKTMTNYMYSCTVARSSFKQTGPVIQLVSSHIQSESVVISWNKPAYVHDVPYGYSIEYWKVGYYNECRTVVVNMGLSSIPENYKCPNERAKNLVELEPIKLHGLRPYSLYQIIVSPINENKIPVPSEIQIKTLEGKSGPIDGLNYTLNSNKELKVSFQEPKNPNGVILSYQVELWIQDKSVCRDNNLPRGQSIYKLMELKARIFHVPYKLCSQYTVSVTPINGWSEDNGHGEYYRADYSTNDVKTTFSELRSELISRNVLRIYWKLQHEGSCGFIAMSVQMSQYPSSSCLKRIIYVLNDTQVDCWYTYIPETTYCNEKSVSHLISLDTGFIISSWLYSTAAVEITLYARDASSRIIKLYAQNKEDRKFSDCFTDCYSSSSYNGIRSATTSGSSCQTWSQAGDYASFIKSQNARSNFCLKVGSNSPWCPIKGGWENCDIPRCDQLRHVSHCIPNIHLSSTSTFIMGNWSSVLDPSIQIQGYIIAVHNEANICIQALVQFPQEQIKNMSILVRNMFIACGKIQYFYTITNEFNIYNLINQHNYFIYIIPIIDLENIGSVRKSSISTKLAKPSLVSNITVHTITKTKLIFNWSAAVKTSEFGAASEYELILRDEMYGYYDRRVGYIGNSIEFDKLVPCRRYCLYIKSINSIGSSMFAGPACGITVSELYEKLGTIDLYPVYNGYNSRKQLSWSYSGNDKCAKLYTVTYRLVNSTNNESKSVNTSDTYVILTNLKHNKLYEVQVKASFIAEGSDRKARTFSQFRQFYTGNERVDLEGFSNKILRSRRSIQLHWKITEYDRGTVLAYLIVVRNISDGNCVRIIRYRNSDSINTEPNDDVNEAGININSNKKEIDCLNATDYLPPFNSESLKFKVNIDSEKRLANYSLLLYGRTIIGWRLFTNKSEIYLEEKLFINNITMSTNENILELSWLFDKSNLSGMTHRSFNSSDFVFLVTILSMPEEECQALILFKCPYCYYEIEDRLLTETKCTKNRNQIQIISNYTHSKFLYKFKTDILNSGSFLQRQHKIKLYGRAASSMYPFRLVANVTGMMMIKDAIGKTTVIVIMISMVVLIFVIILALLICTYKFKHKFRRPIKSQSSLTNIKTEEIPLNCIET